MKRDGTTKLEQVTNSRTSTKMTATMGVLVGAVAGGIVGSMLSKPEVRKQVYESAQKTFTLLKDEFMNLFEEENIEEIAKKALPSESSDK